MTEKNLDFLLTEEQVLNALIENDPHTMQHQITAKSLGEDLSTLACSRVSRLDHLKLL